MITPLLILVAASSVQFVPAQSSKAETEIFICHEDTFAGKNWQRVSVLQLAPILRHDRDQFEIKVHRAACNETMLDTTCAALPGKMFCRQSALRRMNLVAAWYADKFIGGRFDNYETFRATYDRPVLHAFRYVDGLDRSHDTATVYEPLRSYLEQTLQGVEPDGVPEELQKIAAIQNRIMAFNLAALVGHEALHSNEEICPIRQASRMERSGLFDHILEVQTSDRLFCPSFPNPNEIKADRCAARQIERLHSSPINGWDDDEVLEAFAQRAASDLIAFQSLTGFRRFGQPVGRYAISDFDAYLNPVFRLALLAGSVSYLAGERQICGDSARLFVQGVQIGFQQCGGKGEVSDELLALVPPGVEESWNGAPWSSESYSCE